MFQTAGHQCSDFKLLWCQQTKRWSSHTAGWTTNIIWIKWTLTECQHRYEQIEKELLATVCSCEKLWMKLRHCFLEKVFRLKATISRWTVSLKWDSRDAALELHIAHTLSRAFFKEQTEDLLEKDLETMVTSQLPILEEKLHKFRKAPAENPELQDVERHYTERYDRMKEVWSQKTFSPIWLLEIKLHTYLD